MDVSSMMQDGNNTKLLAIGGSGKLGKYCIIKWINEGLVKNVWNFDINELSNNNVFNITENILEENGYKLLSSVLRKEKPTKVIIFAGYDFPRTKNCINFNSPYSTSKIDSLRAWEINCVLPLLILKCINDNQYKNISLTLIGSLYGDRLPKENLYADDGSLYKPVVYGMCKSALEYLNKQASITMAKVDGRCNLLRFGGIDTNIDDEFKKRYANLSPSNNMVSLQSVYQALTFVGINNIKDLNGAIIDLDSGMRHT